MPMTHGIIMTKEQVGKTQQRMRKGTGRQGVFIGSFAHPL